MLYKPDIIILGTIFDYIEHYRRQYILKSIKELYPESTLIHFASVNSKNYDFEYDGYYFIQKSSVKYFKTLKEFTNFEDEFFIKKINEL